MKPISLPAQLVRTRRFTLGIPDQFTIAPGGTTVLFVRSRSADDPRTGLWAMDLDTGSERLLADPADSYALDGTLAAFTRNSTLWTIDITGGATRSLTAQHPATDPRPDPTGRRIAYLSAGALRVIEADGTADRALAEPDGAEVTFGIGAHTHATAIGKARGYWWAPDGARLLAARVDSSAVALWRLPDSIMTGTPPRAIRYAAAGQANEQASLWILGLDGSRTEARFAGEYLVGAGWDAHGPYAVVQSRDQRTVRFLAIDPQSGRTTLLAEQRDECWVQLLPGLPARTASGALLTHLDRDGTRQLTVDGVAVTPPGLQLRSVLAVDGDDVLFTASDEPAETHLWSYQSGEIHRISTEPGVHTGVRRDDTVVHIARDTGCQISVLRNGKPAATITSLAEPPVLDARATPLKLGPRELRARLYLPSWHRPGGRLPILLDPYGGAGRQQVTAELDWRALVSQWFAEHGFAVLAADGRGTPGRGPAWEREVHGDLLEPVLDDQVTALHAAAQLHPELDVERVGIRGWSFGGTLAAFAVLRRPDVFHAAVAGAGVTDQLLYHTHWRERFLGHPDDFPQRYQDNSLVRMAPRLERPLLLIHGLSDANVHPANTIRLSAALAAAHRQHEVLLLPGVGHQAFGSPITENLLQHQVRFLRRHLRTS